MTERLIVHICKAYCISGRRFPLPTNLQDILWLKIKIPAASVEFWFSEVQKKDWSFYIFLSVLWPLAFPLFMALAMFFDTIEGQN